MSFNIDVRGCRRGKCSCGNCDEFFLRNIDTSNGWCQYCNHPPVEHELLEEIDARPVLTPLLDVPSTSTDNGGTGNNLTEKEVPSCKSTFNLPEFSRILNPLLEGEELNCKDQAMLSSLLKEEIISYLNQQNLISNESTSVLRWKYRQLGECLVEKYPRMLWDTPSHRQRKVRKENSPIYTVFIRRLSQRRKMQRLRKKCKKIEEIVIQVNQQISPEDAVLEIKSITSAVAINPVNYSRVIELLKVSYEMRQLEQLSELPPYLMAQIYLETEVELRLEASITDMETKIKESLVKMSSIYSVSPTLLELEKLMQPKRATWNSITMGDYDFLQTRPGPSIFFGKEKLLVLREQVILLDDCDLNRAAIILLGIYFILNLNFPAAYGQFLGLLQNILVKNEKFPKQFSSNHLLQVTKNLM